MWIRSGEMRRSGGGGRGLRQRCAGRRGCGGRKGGVEEEVLVSAALDEMVVEGGSVDSRKVRHAATWIQRSCIQVAGFAL